MVVVTSSIAEKDIESAFNNGQKTKAIKYYRIVHRVDLKSAKAAIDSMQPKNSHVKNRMGFRYKIFFLCFFAIALAMFTQNAYMINASLISIIILGGVIVIDTVKDSYISSQSIDWPSAKCYINSSSIKVSDLT